MPPNKSVRVPFSETREGCRLLVEKVRGHVSNAAFLASAGRLQAAALFALLGFEESGKLLQLIQSAAIAETRHASIVEMKDFRDHEGKAKLTSEYVGRVLNIITSALRSAGLSDESVAGYSDHLTAIRNGFMELRAGAMFVDYVNGMWSSGRSVSGEFLQMDILSLGFFASVAEDALAKHGGFSDLVARFDSLDRELREGLPKFLQELVRLTSGGETGGNPSDAFKESTT